MRSECPQIIVFRRNLRKALLRSLEPRVWYHSRLGAFLFCRHSNITHFFGLRFGCRMGKDPLIRGRYLVSEMLQELREDFFPSSMYALMRAMDLLQEQNRTPRHEKNRLDQGFFMGVRTCSLGKKWVHPWGNRTFGVLPLIFLPSLFLYFWFAFCQSFRVFLDPPKDPKMP